MQLSMLTRPHRAQMQAVHPAVHLAVQPAVQQAGQRLAVVQAVPRAAHFAAHSAVQKMGQVCLQVAAAGRLPVMHLPRWLMVGQLAQTAAAVQMAAQTATPTPVLEPQPQVANVPTANPSMEPSGRYTAPVQNARLQCWTLRKMRKEASSMGSWMENGLCHSLLVSSLRTMLQQTVKTAASACLVIKLASCFSAVDWLASIL